MWKVLRMVFRDSMEIPATSVNLETGPKGEPIYFCETALPARVTIPVKLRKARAITFFADNYVGVLQFAVTKDPLSASA